MKKFLPYILILTIFIGTFAPFEKVFASQANPYEECNTDQTNKPCTPYFCWDNDGNVYRSGIGADICYNAGYRWGSIEQYGTGSSKYNPKPGVLAEEKPTDSASCGIKTGWSFGGCLAMILARIVWILMKIASFILGLAGMLLNFVINITVVQMADNMSGMTGINVAWKIIRDVMNIGFIFLLVFQGVKLIISQDDIGSIKNFIFGIVLASLLINFSLFFTRVIIDSSNIITIGIYNSIVGDPDGKSTGADRGLSNSVMQSLGIQSFMSLKGIDMTTDSDEYANLVSNLMATVLFLITAFVFLAVSAMFVVRYIVLIFLLTLSPVAYMGLAFKDLKATASQWWSTLMGQIIFAPLFMLMMLVTLTLIAGNVTMATQAGSVIGANVESLQGGALQQTLNTLFNYVIIIGFMIASLVTAKKYSAQGNSYVSKMSGWANSKATQLGGKAVFGVGGAVGRNTIGAGASRLAQSQGFQNWAGNSWVGQQALRATRGAATSSFDVRATAAGAGLRSALGSDLGKAQEGGYDRTLADKTKKKEAFGQSLRGNRARENYAARISGGMFTRGGSNSSTNTVFGVMGRSDRVVASRILNGQLTPLETNEQNLTNRENQLSQQLTNMNNELAALNATPLASRSAQQTARINTLSDTTTTPPPAGSPPGTPPIPTNRNSIAYIDYQLTSTQNNLARVTAEVSRIRGLIGSNGLQNSDNRPGYGITNAQTNTTRGQRADEQNF